MPVVVFVVRYCHLLDCWPGEEASNYSSRFGGFGAAITGDRPRLFRGGRYRQILAPLHAIARRVFNGCSGS